MASAKLAFNLENTKDQFQQATAQTKLLVLHYLAKQLHRASTTAAPSAFFSQKVQGLLKQVQQLPREDRYEALQEVLAGVPTRLTEVYEELDVNMRMAFWYRLMNSRRGDLRLSRASSLEVSASQNSLLSDLASRDSNELVSFLREAVSLKPVAYSYQ